MTERLTERDITLPSGEIIHVVVDDPETQFVTAIGAVYDTTKHRIVKGPPKGGPTSLSLDVNRIAARQVLIDRSEDAVRQAIATQDKLNPGDFYAGWKAIAANLVKIAGEKTNRDAVMAFQALQNAAGLTRDRRSTETGTEPGTNLSNQGIAQELFLLMMAEREARGE